MPNRVEICRDHHGRRSCKICASCFFFSKKSRNYTLLVCQIFGPKIPLCKFFVKSQVWSAKQSADKIRTIFSLSKQNFVALFKHRILGCFDLNFWYSWTYSCQGDFFCKCCQQDKITPCGIAPHIKTCLWCDQNRGSIKNTFKEAGHLKKSIKPQDNFKGAGKYNGSSWKGSEGIESTRQIYTVSTSEIEAERNNLIMKYNNIWDNFQ